MNVRGARWRESKRAVATNRAQCCSAKFTSLALAGKKENQRKSRGKRASRRSWSFMSACCTVASADNFFPGVKSLSSPPRFPKKRVLALERREREKRATRCRKVLRCRTCSAVAAALPRERDQKLSLGEDTTLTIRALSSTSSHSSALFLFGTLMEYVKKMRSVHEIITKTFKSFDPAEYWNFFSLKGKIFCVKRFCDLTSFWIFLQK